MTDPATTVTSLFRGRTDAFGLTLSSGSVVTCSSQWAAQALVRKGEVDAAQAPLLEQPVHLGREHFAAHLLGDLDIGVLPLLEDGTCWWGGADLDGDKFSSPADCGDAASRLLTVLRRWDLAPQLFTSRSDGFHVLVFFAAPVPAWAVRAILAAALRETGLPETTERFPKQDHPSTTRCGLGNWLRCPYFGKAAPGRRVALDHAGEPLALGEWLGRVERIPAGRITALAAKLGAQSEVPPLDTRAAPARAQRELSPAIAHLLRRGGPSELKPDRSRWVLSIALGFVNAGRTFEEYFTAVRDPRNAGGVKIQEIKQRKGLKTARDYAEGRWRKAQERVAANPPFRDRRDACRVLLEVERAAETRPWGGRSGPTDRAMLSAHLAIAWSTGKLVHHASVRTVAEMAGVTSRTVPQARRRLAGWLRCVRPASAERAATWKLQITTWGCEVRAPYLLTQRGEAGLYGARTSHPLADPASDVWRHGRGLGKGGWRAWLALDPPATTREIQRRLGVGVRAAQQRLARLAEHGLAARDAEGVWHRLEPAADEVAARLGTAGMGRRQRWRHQDEREVHRKAVEFHRWERRQEAAKRGRARGCDRDACASDRGGAPSDRPTPPRVLARGPRHD